MVHPGKEKRKENLTPLRVITGTRTRLERDPRPLSPYNFEHYVPHLLDHPARSTGVPKYITGSTREKYSGAHK